MVAARHVRRRRVVRAHAAAHGVGVVSAAYQVALRVLFLPLHGVALLDVSEDAETALGWNQTRDDLLSHVLGRGAQQVFQLDAAELFDEC